MSSSKTAFAHLRVSLDLRRPRDSVLDVRIRYWLRDFAWLLKRRDTPRDDPRHSNPPGVSEPDAAPDIDK